jgi:putative restriction endonuclease
VALLGTIAITDYGWYQFLSQRRYWDEANFWTPSAHWTFRAPEFSPFLFKLKAPHNAIAGFGYFARYARLPEWLAWESFSEANGCSSFEEMHSRVEQIRRRFRYVQPEGIPQIGCIIVVNVSFFSESEWIPQPADWPVRNLRPTRYDLETGEGARVWQECLHRSASYRVLEMPDDSASGVASRYGSPLMIRPRLGQGAFRVSVTEAYNRACAATGEHSLPALDAAHIKPFAKDGPHEVRNGLLLRADLHRLLEQGYVTVTHDQVLEVSNRLRDDYHNGRSYYPLHGTRIALPAIEADRPSRELLAWHNQHVFLS